jgi:putative transposase
VKANQAQHAVSRMCRLLGVSSSGYYDWRRHSPSARAVADEALLEQIGAYHARSRGTYGAPRIQCDLAAAGLSVSRKRIARLMRQASLRGVCRRAWRATTRRQPGAQAAPDLVERDFGVAGPDRLWVADITYVPTLSGTLYLAVVVDAFSRRVVGWSMASHLRTELVLSALDMALLHRTPREVIHHSDKGCQYTSLDFAARCQQAGVRLSTGTAGDCYDNAMCESFFATLECELIDRYRFASHSEAQRAIFSFIEGFYNPHRRHSALGYRSPIDFERSYDLARLAA